jgi:hypothetical protein
MVKSLVLFLLGLSLVLPARAEWVKLGQAAVGTSDSLTHYWDPTSVRKTANGRRAWVVESFEHPQQLADQTYMSLRVMIEFDCIGERLRALSNTVYSAPMLKGKPFTFEGDPTPWNYVGPGTVNDARLKAVCNASLPK